jgi:hypothetical protein
MQSESARASSAAEALFRIDAPNSLPKTVKVIALDPPSEKAVAAIMLPEWSAANFLTASAFTGEPPRGDAFSMKGWLSDLAGRTKNLIEEIAAADLVVMVATAGADVPAAALIGDACRARSVMTIALVRATDQVADRLTSHTLAQVRPYALMVVAASAEDYIADMLTALRA